MQVYTCNFRILNLWLLETVVCRCQCAGYIFVVICNDSHVIELNLQLGDCHFRFKQPLGRLPQSLNYAV